MFSAPIILVLVLVLGLVLLKRTTARTSTIVGRRCNLLIVLGLLAAKKSRTKDDDENEHDWGYNSLEK